MKWLIIAVVFMFSVSVKAADTENMVTVDFDESKLSRSYYISTSETAETLALFYNIACKEYYDSNFRASVELFEEIAEKTDSYPMAYYFISKIYKDVQTLQDHSKSSAALLDFIEQAKKKKMHTSFITSSYDDLIDMEKNPEKCLRYALMALEVQEDMMSNQCMTKAAEKMIIVNGDRRYLETFTFYATKNMKIFQRIQTGEAMDADTPQLRGNFLRTATK